MYKVFQIANGIRALIEQYHDFDSAKRYAVELSRIKDAVYYIMRDNGNPLVYLYRGEATVDAPAIMAQLSKPEPPPILELEPPAPEESDELSDAAQELYDATEDYLERHEPEADEQAPENEPKPRRRRKPGPKETN